MPRRTPETLCWFDPRIPGLDELLPPQGENGEHKGFLYYRHSGLTTVAYGPPGVGKTILALQMAVAAAAQGRTVIYLTKDTPPEVLAERVLAPFRFFELWKPDPGAPTTTARHPWLWLYRGKPGHAFSTRPALKALAVVSLDGLAAEIAEVSRRVQQEPVVTTQPAAEHWAESVLAKGLAEAATGNPRCGVLAFAKFTESVASLATMDRYLSPASPMDALGHFQPGLRPVLETLQYWRFVAPASEGGADRMRDRGLFIVCDSLTPDRLGDQLHLQHLTGAKQDLDPRLEPGRGHRGSDSPAPLLLFVLESPHLPEDMGVAFPPDVQIRLGLRDEAHGVRTRTLQLVKTRNQKSLDEETNFLIVGSAQDRETATEAIIEIAADGKATFTYGHDGDKNPSTFRRRALGLSVMPPPAAENRGQQEGRPEKQPHVTFGIAGLDKLTEEGSLAGGGCTLVVTQNRCGSTALSLHYLLAQAADKAAGEAVPDVPNSVLLVSFSGDIADTIHAIWRHPRLRRALWDSKRSPGAAWKALEKGLQDGSSEGRTHGIKHRLYKIPLRHVSENCPADPSRKQTPLLYIYVPDFAWVTAEEAMDRITSLLELRHHGDELGATAGCGDCLRIDRVVVDRVGRLPARWPLVQNPDIFVSGVAAVCARRAVDLMLVDDTAGASETGVAFHSRWAGIAQNIIRLRRIPFHGSEAMTLELVRAAGRLIVAKRPQEITFHHGSGGFEDELQVQDSFRGYTGLFTGEPKRCILKVDLSYDEIRTPLYRDVCAAKGNLESTMDGIQVRTMSTTAWMGVNSAFSNLSSVSRDTCHIVAIDEFWLKSLLEDGTLHRLTNEELHKVVPEHVRHAIRKPGDKPEAQGGQPPNAKQPLADASLERRVRDQYVTRAMTTAIARIPAKTGKPVNQQGELLGEGLHYAVPMRHNWGVLAVARPSRQYMRQILQTVLRPADNRGRRDAPRVSRPGVIALHRAPTTILKRAWKRCRAASPASIQDPELANAVGSVVALLTGTPVNRCVAILKQGEGTTPIPDCAGKVHARLWETDANLQDGLAWRDLADFRTDLWVPFWHGSWFEDALSPRPPEEPPSQSLWVALCPRIDLFGFADTTEESVVSFLLELLLAEVAWHDLFETKSENGVPVAKFRQSAFDRLVPDALVLLYRLLSPRQRRLLGIGVRTGEREIGYARRDASWHGDPSRSEFATWPTQICLLSRQWVTTIEDLFPRYDLRESITMTPLLRGTNSQTFWEQVFEPGKVPADCGSMGPTVAGTWYLGVLRGGNTDLGAEVMREILAADHERSRFLNRCGGPVTAQIYREALTTTPPKPAAVGENVKAQGKPTDTEAVGGNTLPYAEVIAELYATPDPPAQPAAAEPIFPFHRTQVFNYNEAAVILYDLVRHVMRLPVENEGETLRSGQWTTGPEPGSAPHRLLEAVQALSRRAAARLASVGAAVPADSE